MSPLAPPGAHQLRWCVPLLLLCASCTPTTPGWTPPEGCLDDDDFFRQEVQARVLTPICADCHTAEGNAGDSDFVLVGEARPDWLTVNRAVLAEIAGLSRDGESVVLRKPTGLDDHGGGELIAAGSAEWAILEEFVRRLDDPVELCEGEDDPTLEQGLLLASPVATLRTAALDLAGRLPTPAEAEAVRFGGEEALAEALDALMEEEGYIERMQLLFNDELLTDRYLDGDDALDLLDDDRYPQRYWYDAWPSGSERNLRRDLTNFAVAREPLELLAHILRQDLPATELVTADYTMGNAFSAMAYGLRSEAPDPTNPAHQVFEPLELATPQAGVLSTAAFLGRFPTTDTNRNRHRARIVFDRFLATDILALADRPIDPDNSTIHNPTLNDPQCNVCHAIIDPVAGTFQNRADEGEFALPEEGWYPEMAIPGFGEDALPFDRTADALPWLGAQIAADARFPVAMTRTLFEGFTGWALLSESAAQDEVEVEAARRQADFLTQLADDFVAHEFSLKVATRQLLLSSWYRAIDYDDATALEGHLQQAGAARLLTPEQLDRRIEAVFGFPWKARNNDPYLLDDYRILYGGIDSEGVVTRLTEPNGIMGAIGLRLATELACSEVPQDFVLPREQRRLFPHVEASWAPLTEDGLTVPEAAEGIRANIQWLGYRLLGEDWAADHEEVEALYQLWLGAWQAGRAAVEADEVSGQLPSGCRAQRDRLRDEYLPDHLQITRDDDYTLRAWMAVTSALLADFAFLYQ